MIDKSWKRYVDKSDQGWWQTWLKIFMSQHRVTAFHHHREEFTHVRNLVWSQLEEDVYE